MKTKNPLLNVADVEYVDGTTLAKKITCKKCGIVVFSVPDHAKKSEIEIELVGLRAHFAIQHNFEIVVTK